MAAASKKLRQPSPRRSRSKRSAYAKPLRRGRPDVLKLAAALAALIVSGSAAFAVMDDWLPWAHKETVAQIDARSLQWRLESLESRLYSARQACRKGDRLACDETRRIEAAIRDVQAMLKQRRGF